MSNNVVSGVASEQSQSSTAMESAGTLMRKARESAGMHIGVLAATIKIPVKKLEALEADALHEMHDLVFTRALASSVCRTLRIDPQPVLAALPNTRVNEIHVDDHGINEPFSRFEEVPIYSAVKGKISRPALLLVSVLIVGAIGMVALPRQWIAADEVTLAPSVGVDAGNTSVSTPVVIPAPSGDQTAADAGASVAPVAPAALRPVADSPAAPLSTAVVPEQAAVATAATAAQSNQQERSAAPSGVFSVHTRGQAVWMAVVDARGETLLRRTLLAGERYDAPAAALPLSVVVGKADAVEVFVRGKSLDLATLARDNVARFEVK